MVELRTRRSHGMIRNRAHRETAMPRLPRRGRLVLVVLLVEEQRLVVDKSSQHQSLVLHAPLDPVLEGEHHGARRQRLRVTRTPHPHLALGTPHRRDELALQRLLHRDALLRVYASSHACSPTKRQHPRQQFQRRAVRVRVHLAEVRWRQVVQRQQVLVVRREHGRYALHRTVVQLHQLVARGRADHLEDLLQLVRLRAELLAEALVLLLLVALGAQREARAA